MNLSNGMEVTLINGSLHFILTGKTLFSLAPQHVKELIEWAKAPVDAPIPPIQQISEEYQQIIDSYTKNQDFLEACLEYRDFLNPEDKPRYLKWLLSREWKEHDLPVEPKINDEVIDDKELSPELEEENVHSDSEIG